LFEGWDDSKRYRELISRKAVKLCTLCAAAKTLGEYRYHCEGCAVQVAGTFDVVRDLLNVVGKAFCRDCMYAFYGRYDARNPALLDVLTRMADPKKRRSAKYRDSEASQRLFVEEMRYADTVRRRSRANLGRYPEITCPRNGSG
jgi:hypothetical protein